MTKQELREYRALSAELAQLQALERAFAEGLVAPHEDTTNPRKVRDIYARKQEQAAQQLQRIEAAIETLPADDRVLLRAYYVQGLTWEQVADLLHYTVRQIHRRHGRALLRLAKD
jgi:RNA polymerase sigma factor (sigma-70 family)